MKILGHRGIRQEDRSKPYQNTIEAIKYALDKGSDGVEIDIWMSNDNKIFVIHDNEVEKHSNSSKIKITESLSSDIFKVSLDKNIFSYRIPLLSDVIKIIKEHKKILNIEIKQPGISRGLISEINGSGIDKQNVTISSFHHGELEDTRKYDKDINIGILFDSEDGNNPEYYDYLMSLDKKISSYCFIPNCYTTNEKILHSEKIKFFWTIKNKEIDDRLADKLMILPNSNFIADFPEILIPYIKQNFRHC